MPIDHWGPILAVQDTDPTESPTAVARRVGCTRQSVSHHRKKRERESRAPVSEPTGPQCKRCHKYSTRGNVAGG
jgi:hypothetical protein